MALSMEDIKGHAKSLGLTSLPKTKNKEALIHAIQLAEGHVDCFKKIPDCMLSECKWFGDCVGSR